MPFHTENGIFFALFSQNTCTVQKHPLSLHPQTRNKGVIAQLVEQRTENPCVPGSIPGDTTFGEASECSAVGSALRSGRRGRAFESPHSDRLGLILKELSLFCSVFVPQNREWILFLGENIALDSGNIIIFAKEVPEVSGYF